MTNIVQQMNELKLTRKQQDYICYVIGAWYLAWKGKIAPGEHRLGYAKEQLKEMLCSDNTLMEYIMGSEGGA